MLFLEELSRWEKGLRVLCALLCKVIYRVIAAAYDLFINISTLELLNSNEISEIYKRVTLILTIVMVFYVTFEFVKYIVQPETMTDKEKGAQNIIKKMVIVIVLLAFVPKIFSLSYKVQNSIIRNELLTKIIIGKTSVKNGNINTTADKFGNTFSAIMLHQFYYVEDSGIGKKCDGQDCEGITKLNISNLNESGSVPNLTLGIESEYIHFDEFLAVIVGGFIAYMLILYCIDVGARTVQLIYLQIIAPIPIIGYISPKKDGIFQKWGKQCITTYLDVFIRLSIIYFIMLICNFIINADIFAGFNNQGLFVKIALIMGLLVFAKRAPKMIQELFPSMGAASGNFGLKPGERNLNFGRIFGAAAGTAIGAAAGAASGIAQGLRRRNSLDGNASKWKKAGAGAVGATGGFIKGTLGGMTRGFANGVKKGNPFKNSVAGAQKQVKENKRFGAMQENGYTMGKRIEDSARGVFGVSREEAKNTAKTPLERASKEREAETKYRKEMQEKAFKNAVEKGKGNSDARVGAAVANYKKFEDKKKAITDPNSEERNKYKAGKIRQDEASQQTYNDALKAKNDSMANIEQEKNKISEDTLGIDKNAYRKQSTVLSPNGTPYVVFDKEAYDKAVDEAKTKKAQELIEAKFNDNIKDCVYKTDAEAEMARAQDEAEIDKQMKKAKDEVQFAYEDWALKDENDAEMQRMAHAREEESRLYNVSFGGGEAGTGAYGIRREEEIEEVKRSMAEEIKADGESIEDAMKRVSQAEAEDKWIKEKASKEKEILDDKVREINAEIEAIKRQTSGSEKK